jgi:hypothetical protein
MKRDRASSDLLAAIDALIEALSAPLSRADKRAGWDERLQKSWHKHFTDLRERIAHGEWPRDERHHLMRWLNFEGIGLGPLAETVRFAPAAAPGVRLRAAP